MRPTPCPLSAFCSPLPLTLNRGRPQLLPRPSRAPRANAQPPKTKPVFYKNPSKAIEKGGGFYVPGLRGPRLRFFAASVAGSLLTVNHALSSAQAPSLANSERLAAIAVLAVLATALFDSVRPERGRVGGDKPAPALGNAPSDSAAQPGNDGDTVSASAAASWAMTVCTDLTPVTHIAHFRNHVLLSFSGNVAPAATPGEAVERVLKEARSIYINDTSVLPAEVTFPFLGDGVWSVFLVPNEQDVVAFARKGKDGLSVEDRRWLGVFAKEYIS